MSRTGPLGSRAIIQSAVAGTAQGLIGLTEALLHWRMRRAHQSHTQKDFKLGSPSSCCTVPGRGHPTGPQGLWAIIQSAVTVPGRTMSRTH